MYECIKILVIEDSEDDRLLYRRTLQKSQEVHYRLLEADHGEAGLAMIGDKQPACVLLDYSMPGHNGIEILKRICSLHPFLPVVMLTGQGNEHIAVSAMQEGAQNYISKATITTTALDHVITMAINHCAMQKRIHEQRVSLEIFTRALAHDLKEPVRTINSFVELIAENEQLSEKASSHFQHIRNAAERMHMLIDMVFLYTRLDEPVEMVKASCDSAKLLKEVEDNIDTLIRERCAIITSEALPHVYANAAQLLQLLQHLVCNAIRHNNDEVPTVHIYAERQDDNWLFHVIDNGPGICHTHYQTIFEPFKRLQHDKEHGAGLGLAICRKIVESHHGRIWCESLPGSGSSFLFTLPVDISDTGVTDALLMQEVPPENEDKLVNILLVDDNQADIEITRYRLERSHLQCNLLVATNGEEALAALDASIEGSSPIDLLLLDVNMPEMDGFDVLEQVRKNEALRDVLIVMCSGSNYDQDMRKAKELGATGYLVKPIELGKLKSLIETTTDFKFVPDNDGLTLLRSA